MLRKSRSQPLHNLDTNETPLLIACRKGLHDIAEALLEHSPKILFISEARNQLSPLHVACSRGDTRMVELILNAIKKYIDSVDSDKEIEVSLDFRDELGRTPLYNACYYGYFEVVRLLVDFQRENSACVSFNVNAAVKVSQRTPLHVAVRKGSLEIVRLLLTMKNININPEGRPSGRTQKKLIDNYQKMSHGSSSLLGLEKQESIIEEGEVDGVFIEGRRSSSSVTAVTPMSPPGTRTPDSLSLLSSLSVSLPSASMPIPSNISRTSSHIDDSIGFVAPPPSVLSEKHSRGSANFSKSFATPPPPPRSYSTVPKKRYRSTGEDSDLTPIEEVTRKKRSQTDTDSVGSGETNLRVLENQKTGKLEFQMKSSLSEEPLVGTDFDQIFITPLAEACACFHTSIMKLLLLHGARDDKGLACRIAHLIQRPDLIKLILSFHSMLREGVAAMKEIEDFIEMIPPLELNWSDLKLSHCDGDWLGKEAEFYPLPKDQNAEGDGSYASHSSEFCNALRAGPEISVRFDAVVAVKLDNNQLVSVPIELFQLQNVSKINVSGNKIARLPFDPKHAASREFESDGWACPSLTTLNLSKNDLTHLPACVWTLPNLAKLYCSRNKLETLLPELAPIPEDEDLSMTLDTVDISRNDLKGKVSRFLFELRKLRTLNLSDNAIEELPETLWGCESLHDLNVAGNQLSSLPWCETEVVYRDTFSQDSYSQPMHLQKAGKVLVGKVEVKAKFDRMKSLYQRAPSSIRALNSAMEVSITTTADQCDYSSLKKLNLSRNRFANFPEALACFAPNVVDLDVSKNPLKELDVQFLPHLLKKLTAKGCKLERIGTVITKSHQLQVRTCTVLPA